MQEQFRMSCLTTQHCFDSVIEWNSLRINLVKATEFVMSSIAWAVVHYFLWGLQLEGGGVDWVFV